MADHELSFVNIMDSSVFHIYLWLTTVLCFVTVPPLRIRYPSNSDVIALLVNLFCTTPEYDFLLTAGYLTEFELPVSIAMRCNIIMASIHKSIIQSVRA